MLWPANGQLEASRDDLQHSTTRGGVKDGRKKTQALASHASSIVDSLTLVVSRVGRVGIKNSQRSAPVASGRLLRVLIWYRKRQAMLSSRRSLALWPQMAADLHGSVHPTCRDKSSTWPWPLKLAGFFGTPSELIRIYAQFFACDLILNATHDSDNAGFERLIHVKSLMGYL